MAQWILKANGRVVPRRSLRPLKVDEIHSPVEIKKREVFDELIQRRWGTPMTPPNTQQPKTFEKYEDHKQQEQPTLHVVAFLVMQLIWIGWIDGIQPRIPGSVMGTNRVCPHHLIVVDWAQNQSR